MHPFLSSAGYKLLELINQLLALKNVKRLPDCNPGILIIIKSALSCAP